MLPRLLRPLVLAGSALTLGATALALPAAHAATPASYVALGDSYSSGTGTRTYLSDGTTCQRSVYAYPSLISSARGYALNLRACSGAKVADVRSTQLSALTASTSYVTISVGGNDAGFTNVLTTCAMPSWASNCNGAIDGAQRIINGTIPASLGSLYASIRSAAPNAKVVVVGYPRIFNGEDCNLLTWFSPERGDAAQPDRRPAEQQAQRRRERGRVRLRQPDEQVRRARRVRLARVAERAVQPGGRVLPPEPRPDTPPATRRWSARRSRVWSSPPPQRRCGRRWPRRPRSPPSRSGTPPATVRSGRSASSRPT